MPDLKPFMSYLNQKQNFDPNPLYCHFGVQFDPVSMVLDPKVYHCFYVLNCHFWC